MNKRMILQSIVLLIMVGIGVWASFHGKSDLGIALVGASIGVFIVNILKMRRLSALKDKGLNPYDERSRYVGGKAAAGALQVFVLASAAIVLWGSFWGPKISVNPYNMLGLYMTGLIFLYVGFYYYYDRRS